MCLGVPGQLVEVVSEEFRLGTVEVSGVRRSVSLAMLSEEAAVGDWVLVHIGFAIARITKDEADRTVTWLERVAQEHADELQSLDDRGVRRTVDRRRSDQAAASDRHGPV